MFIFVASFQCTAEFSNAKNPLPSYSNTKWSHVKLLALSALPCLKSVIWWYLICWACLFTYCLLTSSQILLMRWFHNSWKWYCIPYLYRWSPSGCPSPFVVSSVNCISCQKMTACEAVWSIIVVSHQSQHTHTRSILCASDGFGWKTVISHFEKHKLMWVHKLNILTRDLM